MRSLSVEILDGKSPAWREDVSSLRRLLGAPSNPRLFPRHFLLSVLSKIGGLTLRVTENGEELAYAFLFPRRQGGYTVRIHRIPGARDCALDALRSEIREVLPGVGFSFYDPEEPQPYDRDCRLQVGGIEIGQPDEGEARAARGLQNLVWKPDSEDDLYPSDLYSTTFGAATSLVVRQGPEVLGFLFGFYRLGGPPLPQGWQLPPDLLRIESQVTGIHPAHQNHGYAYHLKKLQAEQARREGIRVIHWTVDPLLGKNARLNFGKLGAVSFRFVPDLYGFRNRLNRIRASRLEITWLLPDPASPAAGPRDVVNLSDAKDIAIVNDGYCEIHLDLKVPRLAFEIPEDWEALQNSDLETATRWREATDTLFEAYLGPEEGRYVLTDVGQGQGRRYLVAQRIGL
jgi:predicted GNAT superfamily acetyltransferase